MASTEGTYLSTLLDFLNIHQKSDLQLGEVAFLVLLKPALDSRSSAYIRAVEKDANNNQHTCARYRCYYPQRDSTVLKHGTLSYSQHVFVKILSSYLVEEIAREQQTSHEDNKQAQEQRCSIQLNRLLVRISGSISHGGISFSALLRG